MNVKETVREAWQLTNENLRRLIWYGFIPAFFGVIVSSAYLAYQYNAIKQSVYFSDGTSSDVMGFFKTMWAWMSGYPVIAVIAVVLILLILLGYFVLPPIFKGTLITAIKKIRNEQPLAGSLEKGIRFFFPIFEFSIITGAFSITTLFTESTFILRWWGEGFLFAILPILLFIAMAGLIISFLFTYAEYFVVLEDKPLIRSIMDSTILVISNLKKTILVFVLMVLIGARIILNVILFLLIPMLVVFLTTYFANFFSSAFGIALLVFFGMGILIVSAYLLGLFQIFATAVWVLTFEELTEHQEVSTEKVEEAEKAS